MNSDCQQLRTIAYKAFSFARKSNLITIIHISFLAIAGVQNILVGCEKLVVCL